MLHDLAWPALRACALARWSPGIGDPTVMGWLTLAVYAATALLCLVPARQPGRARRVRAFWAALAVLLALFAVNKQLDLQSFLTAIGRCAAEAQGWYEDRRAVQAEVILGLLAAVLALALLLAWVLRRHLGALGLALLGLAMVVAFVDIRALGFHHVDALIDVTVDNVRLNWVLELAGPALIAVNAGWAAAHPPPGRAGVRSRRAHPSGDR